jgi:hypothetical protein
MRTTLVSDLARNALVEIGKPAVASIFNGMFLQMHPNVPVSMQLRALAEIGDYAAIPTLMAALEEDSAMLQHWAEAGPRAVGLEHALSQT